MSARSVRVRGDVAVIQNLRRLGSEVGNKEVGASLYRRGEEIMSASKPLVPVDTGALRSTGHVQLPKQEAGRTTVTLGYGGPAAPYALRQHEELGYRHTVGQAKYLEQPAMEMASEMPGKIATDIEAAVQRELRG